LNASPKSKSEPSELSVSISTPALATPTQEAPPSAESQALLEGFKQFQRMQGNEEPAVSNPAAAAPAKEAPGKSHALLDKFMQWQQRK
jgi:hypothetical protein